MFFRDIVGHSELKRRLTEMVDSGRIPHAQLYTGAEGVGKLALALAVAQYICCEHREGGEPCGRCPSCAQFAKLSHPDLHFVFPMATRDGVKVCSDMVDVFRNAVLENPYITLEEWMRDASDNKTVQIYAAEGKEILHKLSFKPYQGQYKVMIVWLPEKMNVECSNKLLKLLEEPPSQTIFLLVSEEPDMLLTTIQSRTQRFNLFGIEEKQIAQKLTQQFGILEKDAIDIAHRCEGNYLKALETIHLNEENQLFFELFVSLMRLSYQRKIREMKQWSETMASMGRERQKQFLQYCQRMIRENFISNFHNPSITYLNEEERNFSSRFAPFVNERNVIGIMDELSEAQRHIEQNVNARMVFFDFSLKMIVLLVQK